MLHQFILIDLATVIVLVKHKVMNFLVCSSPLFDRPIYISGNIKIIESITVQIFPVFS